MSERVLCFHTAHLHENPELDFTGFSDNAKLGELLCRDIQYVDRDKAEFDESWLQIIPYVIVNAGDRYFGYTRGKKGGENRLHTKQSLGVGGHINPADGETCDDLTYTNGLYRELREELGIQLGASDYPEIVGFIYDPSNSVGKVHFGVVHLLRVASLDLTRLQDEALAEPKWLYRDELKASLEQFETWSQIAIRNIL